MLPTLLLAFLAGPVAAAFGEMIDASGLPLGAFGFLLFVIWPVVRVAGGRAEALAFGSEGQRVWILSRARRWQRLTLPLGTGGVIATGLSCLMTAGSVLVVSAPGWSALNVVSLLFVAFGGLLVGVGLSRLLVSVALVSCSDTWGPSPRAWRLAAAAVALGSVANAAYSVQVAFRVVLSI
jgi:hypothetical protein